MKLEGICITEKVSYLRTEEIQLKKMLKKGMAFILALVLCTSAIPMESMAAAETDTSLESAQTEDSESEETSEGQSEEAGEAIQEEAVQEETVPETEQETQTSEETADSEDAVDISDQEFLLNYIAIDQPVISSPDTQSIIVSIGEEDVVIESAVLRYQVAGQSDVQEIASSQIDGDAILFSKEHADTSETAIYNLMSISFIIEGSTYEIMFSDTGMEPYYCVNCEYNEEEGTITSEDVGTEVVTIDEDGNTTSQNSIEEAIEEAKADTVTSPFMSRSASSGNVVVVLDPGHDATHTGASGNGLKEQDLTLKIAKYCKAELEKYSGVTVYMTRTTSVCAFGGIGIDTSTCLSKRVAYAKSKGAKVLVSLHLNAYNSSVSGAEVYYPNTNYNSSVGTAGSKLATQIQNQLEALGLKGRGIKILNSNSTKYPDGSIADSYAIIRQSKLAGFPGIIVEHAFIDNSGDANKYLKSESGLKSLGVADATGIAKYFGLSKKSTATATQKGTASVSAKGNSSETKFMLTAKNVSLSTSVSGVKFSVWSKTGGQDDLKWYTASKGTDGAWKKSIPISNHKTAGTYYVHVYATASNGAVVGLKETASFTVKGPSASSVKVSNVNKTKGTFTITVSGATSKSGVSKVMIPVWSKSNQSDLYWYTAKKQSDGTYKVTANLSKHKYNYGTYKIHVYVTDKNQIQKMVKSTTQKVSVPTAKITASGNSKQTKYTLTAKNVVLAGGVKGVKFAVWSEAGGKDDLVWYSGDKVTSKEWKKSISISKHKTAGKYQVKVFAVNKSGTKQYIDKMTFTVKGPSASSVKVSNINKSKGTFTITVSGAASKSGVKKVMVPVWSKSNQSDIYWYTAKKQSNGTYKVTANISKHKNNYGTYQVHVYVTDGNGIQKNCGTATAKISSLTAIVGTTSVTKSQMVKLFKASGKTYPSSLKSSGAASIEAFCQIYIEEAKAEGVKAEVAFAQAMLETGYLQFGGDVKVSQNNFCGLGASGGGAAGHSFSSVRKGVRAHIQHLKAYASTDSLNNTCIDPRFSYVKRGCAKYLEWLGQKENPNGYGWATSAGYGNSIVTLIKKMA